MGIKQKKQDKALAGTDKQAGGAAAHAASGPSKVRALGQYFEDAKVELGKVSWPTRKEVRVTSIAVLALVIIMSIFLGIVDSILARIVELILSVGK
jgi:preprotein translocase subunit SecE